MRNVFVLSIVLVGLSGCTMTTEEELEMSQQLLDASEAMDTVSGVLNVVSAIGFYSSGAGAFVPAPDFAGEELLRMERAQHREQVRQEIAIKQELLKQGGEPAADSIEDKKKI